jgi:hypothetical protein
MRARSHPAGEAHRPRPWPQSSKRRFLRLPGPTDDKITFFIGIGGSLNAALKWLPGIWRSFSSTGSTMGSGFLSRSKKCGKARRDGSHRCYRHCYRGPDHFLKSDSDCDLCAVQCGLIDEAGRVVVIIKNPVASLGKDVSSELASDCAVGLKGHL